MKIKYKKDARPVGIITRFIRSQHGVFCVIKLNKQIDGQSHVVAKADFVTKS